MCGLFGPRNSDGGFRLFGTGVNTWSSDYLFTSNAWWYINGKQTRTFDAVGTPYILQTTSNASGAENYDGTVEMPWSLGQYLAAKDITLTEKKGGLRGYKGSVAEVVAYDRHIEGDEQAAITAYLKEKWIDGDTSVHATLPNNIELTNEATLDLVRTEQTVNGLSLSGSGGAIVNGPLTVGGTLEVFADANGDVAPYRFESVSFADGLRIELKSDAYNSIRLPIATGVTAANVSTFTVSRVGWAVSLNDGVLSVGKMGFRILVR